MIRIIYLTVLCLAFSGSCLHAQWIREGEDYTLRIGESNHVAVMEIDEQLYETWASGNATRKLGREMANRVYENLHDDFDFIFFISDEDEVQDGAYYGTYFSVYNDIQGLGQAGFDNTEKHGSDGKLQGMIHLTNQSGLITGPSLNSLAHRWANYLRSMPTQSDFDWGFSSVGGQLGGFKTGSLRERGRGVYDADGPNGTSFGTLANGGNSVPYSNLELYLMGLIGKDEVVDEIQIAVDAEWVDQSEGIFSATSIETFTIDHVIATDGARYPAAPASQKEFKALTIVLSQDELSQERIAEYDEDIRQFSLAGNDNDFRYNFWEATGGRATIQMDHITASIKSDDGDFRGDFDGDGLLTANDIDLLSDVVRTGSNLVEFDLDSDGQVTNSDRSVWIEDIMQTYFGDANLDGEFDSTDLVDVFVADEYEDDVMGNSSWADGDWNGDRDFNTSDLVLSFRNRGYEQGPRTVGGAIVPEARCPMILILACILTRRRKRSSIFVGGRQSVAGINLFAQVGDGGPERIDLGLSAGTDGPAITAIDLKGSSIFSTVPDVPFYDLAIPQVAFGTIALQQPDAFVVADGLLATLTVDTTGFFAGTFDLLLGDLLPSSPDGALHSDFAGLPIAITNGSIEIAETRVVGRNVFYNNSRFDGDNAEANRLDDQAIAFDKTPLLPGSDATIANYTSYSRGINGLILDVQHFLGTPGLGDFQFYVGNNSRPSTWATAPNPSSISCRRERGAAGTDRITLIWPDHEIQNQWLEVRVAANENTGAFR
ncbi:hypothetical protein ACFL2H_08925 [Planctomycetota bacterium]